MPWPVIGKKTDRDLKAIYEYLRALPSLPDVRRGPWLTRPVGGQARSRERLDTRNGRSLECECS